MLSLWIIRQTIGKRRKLEKQPTRDIARVANLLSPLAKKGEHLQIQKGVSTPHADGNWEN